NEEYNIDVELFRSNTTFKVLIHNRTNVYKFVKQLNQNRNDIFFLKRQLEEKNEELEKLRKIADNANEQKSRFLAIMSHEVKNPLNAILGYSELLHKEEHSQISQEYLNNLTVAGKSLKTIVNDILHLSRIEAGELAIVKDKISIEEIVENCIQGFNIQHHNKEVQLRKISKDALSQTVFGDGIRVYQILSNLLSNALKFTKQGFVELTTSLISEDETMVLVKFEVEDSGRGMTETQTEKIFKEYKQTSSNDNRLLGGAGLGLAIVKRLVFAMNGSISVISTLNIGTKFTVELPFEKHNIKSSEKKAPIIEEKNTSLKNKKILFADDDLMNQAIVKHILLKEKVILTVVDDGLKALEKLKVEAFDIILLDIFMPNMTGNEVVEKKSEFKEENRAIPIFALTANSQEKEVKEYLKVGFTDIISKPFTQKEFFAKLSLVLNE
ncbi:ATP-binding protein, partial [Polaribacter sp.]|nr:ATP-binding protein [Polaribacter sp.]